MQSRRYEPDMKYLLFQTHTWTGVRLYPPAILWQGHKNNLHDKQERSQRFSH